MPANAVSERGNGSKNWFVCSMCEKPDFFPSLFGDGLAHVDATALETTADLHKHGAGK